MASDASAWRLSPGPIGRVRRGAWKSERDKADMNLETVTMAATGKPWTVIPVKGLAPGSHMGKSAKLADSLIRPV